MDAESRDVQTITPPSQPTLCCCVEGRHAGPKGWLFSGDECREELLEAYPELAEICDRIRIPPGIRIKEWDPSPGWALHELARAALPPVPCVVDDLSSADLSELISDLINCHHLPLRNELRRLGILIDHWSLRRAIDQNIEIPDKFRDFSDRLVAHLDLEESHVFPQCLAVDKASRLPRGQVRVFNAVTPSIRTMMSGHEESGFPLQQIRDFFDLLAHGEVNHEVKGIQFGLSEIASDMVVHTAIEENYLIPAAIFAEDQVRARHGLG